MKLHNVTGRDFRELDTGADPARDILIPAGAGVEVPDPIAKRLLDSFPKRFSKTAPKAAAVEPDETEDGES